MRKLFALLVSVGITQLLFSQNIVKVVPPLTKVGSLFKRNYIEFHYTTCISQKTSVKAFLGNFSLSSKPIVDWEYGVSYFVNFDTANSIIAGITNGNISHGFSFFADKNSFIPSAGNDYFLDATRTGFVRYYSLPVLYEHRKFMNSNKFVAIDAGFNLRFSPNLSSTITNIQAVFNQTLPVINIDINHGHNFWLNYNAAVNYGWVLKNNQVLKVGIKMNYAPKASYYGDYQINIPGQQTSLGTYKIKGSYMGLNVGYVFTGRWKYDRLPTDKTNPYVATNNRQKFINQQDERAIFSGGHLGFVFAPYFTQKATIQKVYGNYTLGSSPLMGGEFGLAYSYNINTKNAINTGLKFGLLENGYLFTVKKDDFIPAASYDYDIGDYGELNLHYISLPLTYSHRVFFKKPNHFFEISAGVNLRTNYTDSVLIISAVGNNDIIRVELNSENKIWLNYNAGINHSWILRNLNIIKAGLLVNYSNTPIGGGNYSITIPGREPAYGTYHVKGSYAGIELGYILTRAKKRKGY